MNDTFDFMTALTQLLHNNKSCRLRSWNAYVFITAQVPDINSEMTAPYLYVTSKFGKVPWVPTQIEMFSTEWELF